MQCYRSTQDHYARYGAAGILLAVFLIACGSALAANNVEFRPVLTDAESKSSAFDVIEQGGERLLVNRLPYIADRDIKEVEAFRSANVRGRFLIGFTFNEDGLQRFRHLVKTFREKRVAIFSGDRLVIVSSVLPPEFMSERVVIAWTGTEKELREFVARINAKEPGLFELYVEEQGKYNDVAVEAWAEVYQAVSEFIEERSHRSAADMQLVEAAAPE